MKKLFYLIICFVLIFLNSCTIKETIVFHEDGSGQYLLSYDMGDAIKKMSEEMGGDSDKKKDKPGKIVDTTMVFADIMETYKDSVAALPEEKRLAMEAVKDMFMKMKVDEENGVFDFGVGLNFTNINDLDNIQEKVKQAKSLNAQNDQVGAMKKGSPLGKYMGSEDDKVAYNYSATGFSRSTTVTNPEALEVLSEEIEAEALGDETNKEFMTYFESAAYIIEYKFPKAVKSVSLENVEFSDDRKTIIYKTNWMLYLKSPKNLDINVEFVNE